jgi:hypothetical protein
VRLVQAGRSDREVTVRQEMDMARGWGGSVGIAARYGLDGPGIEFRWERDFLDPSRPVLGPTQPPTKWVLVLSGGKAAGSWR